MLSTFKTLRTERVGTHVAVITLNRPESANALNTQMAKDLLELLSSLYVDQQDIRCIVLTGAGERVFCAGADLKEREGMSDSDWIKQHALFEQMVLAFMDCPIPIIAAVNGAAFAGGCELVLLSDFAYASDNARFALTEVTLGIMPGAMGTQNLPVAVGERRAKEIILTGSPFTAEESEKWGMVNKLCSSEELLDSAMAAAETIARNAPLSVRQAKKSVSMANQLDRKTGYQFELEAYNRLVATQDRREGIKSFNEKRRPIFKGN